MWRNSGGFLPCRTLCCPRGTSSFGLFVAGDGFSFFLIHFWLLCTSLPALEGGRMEMLQFPLKSLTFCSRKSQMQTVALIWLFSAEFKGRQDGIQAGGGERRWHIHPSCHSGTQL